MIYDVFTLLLIYVIICFYIAISVIFLIYTKPEFLFFLKKKHKKGVLSVLIVGRVGRSVSVGVSWVCPFRWGSRAEGGRAIFEKNLDG